MSVRALAPGALGPALAAATRRALASGALAPIETRGTVIADDGVRFRVREAVSLRRKDAEDAARERGAAPGNPFLPFEPDLFVAGVSPTHVALLNKFSVLARHLLIVTRVFEHQERWLTRDDFAALAACLSQFESLGFYNGGPAAGASQPHKHLQLVPLPLEEGTGSAVPAPPRGEREAAPAGPPLLPTALLVEASLPAAGVAQVDGFPFVAAATRLDRAAFADPVAVADLLATRFAAAAAFAGVGPVAAADGLRQSAPYNLLVTQDWLLVVPRSREHADGVSINALGYAGSLFVRDGEELARLAAMGPLRALAAAGVTR